MIISWDGWTEEASWRHIFRRQGRRIGSVEINSDGQWDCRVTYRATEYKWTAPTIAKALASIEGFL